MWSTLMILGGMLMMLAPLYQPEVPLKERVVGVASVLRNVYKPEIGSDFDDLLQQLDEGDSACPSKP